MLFFSAVLFGAAHIDANRSTIQPVKAEETTPEYRPYPRSPEVYDMERFIKKQVYPNESVAVVRTGHPLIVNRVWDYHPDWGYYGEFVITHYNGQPNDLLVVSYDLLMDEPIYYDYFLK